MFGLLTFARLSSTPLSLTPSLTGNQTQSYFHKPHLNMSTNMCDDFAFGMCICMGIFSPDLFVIHVHKEQLWLSVLLQDAHR